MNNGRKQFKNTSYQNNVSEGWWRAISKNDIKQDQTRMVTLLMDMFPLRNTGNIVYESKCIYDGLKYYCMKGLNLMILGEVEYEYINKQLLQRKPHKQQYVDSFIRNFRHHINNEDEWLLLHLHGIFITPNPDGDDFDFDKLRKTLKALPQYNHPYSLRISRLRKTKTFEENIRRIGLYASKRNYQIPVSDFGQGDIETRFKGQYPDHAEKFCRKLYEKLESSRTRRCNKGITYRI